TSGVFPCEPMAVCRIDHIIITAPSLDAGGEWVHACLGASPGGGGGHPRMGTHNRVLRLGDTMYLEVIAVDPGAAAPSRPRWFGLDALSCTARPRLAGWVSRAQDIRAAGAAATEALGRIESMSRNALE